MTELEETLNKNIELINKHRSYYSGSEQAVRTGLIEPVLNCLGWKMSDPDYVRMNERNKDGNIPDYTLFKSNKKKLVVEAKNLSIELMDPSVFEQVVKYTYNEGIRFGVLTNGIRWLLFSTFQPNPEDRIVWHIDFENENLESSSRILSSISFDNTDRLETLIQKSEVLEKSWNNMISSGNSIPEIIAQKLFASIKAQHPNLLLTNEELVSFVKGKLENYSVDFIEEEEEKEVPKQKIQNKEEGLTVIQNYIDSGNKPREKISVAFPGGKRIFFWTVKETFVKTLEHIGFEDVQKLGIYFAGINLVSDKFANLGTRQSLEGNKYIYVGISTRDKYNTLNEINQRLRLNLDIQIGINVR